MTNNKIILGLLVLVILPLISSTIYVERECVFDCVDEKPSIEPTQIKPESNLNTNQIPEASNVNIKTKKQENKQDPTKKTTKEDTNQTSTINYNIEITIIDKTNSQEKEENTQENTFLEFIKKLISIIRINHKIIKYINKLYI